MSDTKHHHDLTESVKAGYEVTDAYIGPLWKITTAITVVALLTTWGSWELLQLMDRYAEKSSQPASPLVHPGQMNLPPLPRLQVDPPGDVRKMVAENNEILNNYHMIDKAKGVVGLPIEKAMEMAAQPGRLPSTPGDMNTTTADLIGRQIMRDSSSGRMGN
ncbi:MAG: hypothetical protein K1X53_11275 [Candidatus Sumerlaeaceae bacterium]|nr:hypothetical protein [Candidatus Sumerlaeaceae bacterium]